MRILRLIALFAFLMTSFAGVRVYAEEVTTTVSSSPQANSDKVKIPSSMLDIKASVPDNFDKTVLISMVAADQTNIMGRLDKLNQYTSLQEIDPGTYKLSFINIVGENANGYEIKRPEEIVIKEGKTAIFDIQISLKASSKVSEVVSDEVQEKMVAELMGANDETSRSLLTSDDHGVINAENTNGTTPNVETPPVEASSSSTSSTKRIDDSTLNTIIGVSVLVVVGLLFFLYKQLIYKHDYYDC